MSITFYSDAPATASSKDEPCLCAQMADSFSDFFNGQDTPEMRADLKANANPNCYTCKGTGVEQVQTDDAPTMNLANANAAVFLSMLGLNPEYGEASLPEARRALMRASSRDLSKYTREPEKTYGKPREIEPGVVDMKPVRMFSAGLPPEQLKSYLERFAQFLSEVSRRGGSKIHWG